MSTMKLGLETKPNTDLDIDAGVLSRRRLGSYCIRWKEAHLYSCSLNLLKVHTFMVDIVTRGIPRCLLQ